MARETTKWPSTRWPITKIMSSDGCNGNRVPLEMGPWYDFREFGCHLGNVGLGGCTTIPVGGPSSEEQAAITSRRSAIVLFKAVASKNVKVWALEITGRAEPPRWPQNRAPSSELKGEGWRYLVLPPGNYRVWASAPPADYGREWVTPPTGGQSGFRLNVPRGQPLLYAGDVWKFTAQADKTEMAQAVARAAFPEYGPLNVAPMSLYGAPIESGLLHEHSPIALSSVGEKGFASPDWWNVAIDKGYFAPSEWALGSTKRYYCHGAGCGGDLLALMFGIAYLPIGATLSAVDASLAEDKWGQCMAALARELGERDLLVDLSLRLQEKLREHGLGNVLVLEDADDVAASAAR